MLEGRGGEERGGEERGGEERRGGVWWKGVVEGSGGREWGERVCGERGGEI